MPDGTNKRFGPAMGHADLRPGAPQGRDGNPNRGRRGETLATTIRRA